MDQGVGGSRRHCGGRVCARLCHVAPVFRYIGQGHAGHPGRARGRRPVGHHVYPLPQGLYQRHEPALLRHGLHFRRVRHHIRPGSDLSGLSLHAQALVIAGSLVMIAGAAAIGMAEAPASELAYGKQAMNRECDRYGLDPVRVAAVLQGDDPLAGQAPARRWWEALVVAAALGLFGWLAYYAKFQPIAVSIPWMIVLLLATLVSLGVSGTLLWRRTRFS